MDDTAYPKFKLYGDVNSQETVFELTEEINVVKKIVFKLRMPDTYLGK